MLTPNHRRRWRFRGPLAARYQQDQLELNQLQENVIRASVDLTVQATARMAQPVQDKA